MPDSCCLYIFLDEGGNFDFSPGGTRYFTLSAVSTKRPFRLHGPLLDLKYDLMEEGHPVEFFHASEDRQVIRNRVFTLIESGLSGLRIDTLIVEKAKTHPSVQPLHKFYPKMVGMLLRYVFEGYELSQYEEVIVLTDAVPVKKHRRAVERAVKVNLKASLPPNARYRILHHESKSDPGLQIADYCNWAVYRKWTEGDERSYRLIKGGLKSEFDVFGRGTERFY